MTKSSAVQAKQRELTSAIWEEEGEEGREREGEAVGEEVPRSCALSEVCGDDEGEEEEEGENGEQSLVEGGQPGEVDEEGGRRGEVEAGSCVPL